MALCVNAIKPLVPFGLVIPTLRIQLKELLDYVGVNSKTFRDKKLVLLSTREVSNILCELQITFSIKGCHNIM